MSPDSGMAMGIFLAAFVLPALALLACVAVAVALLFTQYRWAAVLPLVGALGVVAIWFFSFGIEYVPRHSGHRLVLPDPPPMLFLVQVCADSGVEIGDGPVVVPPNGLALVKADWFTGGGVIDIRDWMNWDVEQNGVVTTVSAVSYGGDASCSGMEFWLGTPGENPMTAVDRAVLIAQMQAEGLTWLEVVTKNAI